MKLLIKIFLLHFTVSLCFGQTVQVSSVTGNATLPSYGSVGTTLSTISSYAAGTSGTVTAWVWYKRTNGTDTQISSGNSKITVFIAGDYFVRVTHKVFTTAGMTITVKDSPVFTVLAEAISTKTGVVSTTMLHSGIKSEADLSLPSAFSHGLNSITYSDRLGRSVQSVQCQSSPTRQDIVQPIVYDNSSNGRVTTSYMPFTGDNTGRYHENAVTDQQNFYNTTGKKRASSDKAFSMVKYEDSPYNTIVEQGGVGAVFQPGIPNLKTTTFKYFFNAANEVALWKITGGLDAASATGYYPANSLSVTETKDPEGSVVRIYKDMNGLVILKCQIGTDPRSNNNNKKTYFIYNSNAQLVYEVPYKAVITIGELSTFNSDNATCKGYMHYYQYDNLMRPWYHRAPGAEAVYTVYDRMNRPILTQNGEQRKSAQWSFVKYDNLGRQVFSGLFTDPVNNSYTQIQTLQNVESVLWEQRQSGTTHGYSESNSFPRLSSGKTFQIVTVNYYDDYNFDYDNSNAKGTRDINFYAGSELTAPLPVPDYFALGKTTASKIKVIGSAPEKWIWNVNFYDEMGRVIQTQSNNHLTQVSLPLNLQNSTTFWLDFTGKILTKTEIHKNSNAGISYVIKNTYTYDHVGRLLEEYQQNNNDAVELIKTIDYNEFGQVVQKNLGVTSGTPLQSLDYTYNIQGKLSHINNADRNTGMPANNNDDNNDIFGMQIFYDDQDPVSALITGVSESKPIPKYDGKISAVKWSTNNLKNSFSNHNYMLYNYAYGSDGTFSMGYLSQKATSGGAWNIGNYGYAEFLGAEENGNINAIERLDKSGNYRDNLSYSYTYNKVNSITESGSNSAGFIKNSTGVAYTYNDNGNLVNDLNKNLTIEYNHLDLISKISWKNRTTGANAGNVQYVYDATGAMLQRIYTPEPPGVGYTIDYIDGFMYKSNSLVFFNHSEGRAVKTTTGLVYEYNIKDHKGNSRISFINQNGIATPVQENHFYPSGVAWEDNWFEPLVARNQFTLQGKEFMEDGFGNPPLAWYDFGARMYDPTVARWWAQDPMYQFDSPYTYCGNDPVNGYDPNGMWDWADFDPTRGNSSVRQGFDRLGNWMAQNEKPIIGGSMIVGGAILSAVGYSGIGNPLMEGGISYYGNVGNNMSQGASWSQASNNTMISINYSYTLPSQRQQPTYAPIDPFIPEQYNTFMAGRLDMRLAMAGVYGGPPSDNYTFQQAQDFLDNFNNVLGTAGLIYTSGDAMILKRNYLASKTSNFGSSFNMAKTFYKTGTVLKFAGKGLGWSGILIDGVGMYGNYRRGSTDLGAYAKRSLNIGMGFYGLYGGPPGAIGSGVYFIIDASVGWERVLTPAYPPTPNYIRTEWGGYYGR